MSSGNPFADAIFSGQLLIGLPVAALAGLVSFLSPCVLPLVPGYLGYVSGIADGTRHSRGRVLLGVLLFVLGFTVVFVLGSAAAGAVGFWLVRWRDLIVQLMGIVVIAMGLVFIGRFTFLQRTVKTNFTPRTGLLGAPLLGIVFALGWTPCIGPTLAAINLISFQSGSAWQGVVLGIAYCIGLGVPFLLVALGAGWASGAIGVVKRHMRTVNIIGGAILIVIGLLMVTGIWSAVMSSVGAVIQSYVPAV
ncbi:MULTISPECIES: cytochrome c biogenesis CcdA family protein [unclassified Curtobacterium]|uniref:cytochrome c biogenesis CcdA family protein n=1 Tax=unclassified Curtobacterium TaxID=257496 RepID=UPI000D9AC894|nr:MULTISPECIES: cytochrome c biogenesis protein CcdA [unclassified Curtobacterium]PYY37215.1 cytochrome c biogenesis protein CcdA [Curtobacterium sp. MCBD17_030]PZE36071.1 cytochrome c biogenesis protein CcdA [Curtobacterium sp. MCPF17_031]PZF12719.1 cytochrome c biogenesis protein CcdA [Curtobacterium sp. MCPF17_011]